MMLKNLYNTTFKYRNTLHVYSKHLNYVQSNMHSWHVRYCNWYCRPTPPLRSQQTFGKVYLAAAYQYGTNYDNSNGSDIHFEEFSSLVTSGNIILIDVRQPEELAANGNFENSINIPLGELYQALEMSPEKFKSLYGTELPDYEDSRIVFSCAMGIRSAIAVQIAKELGFSRARHYVGGFEEWSTKMS